MIDGFHHNHESTTIPIACFPILIVITNLFSSQSIGMWSWHGLLTTFVEYSLETFCLEQYQWIKPYWVRQIISPSKSVQAARGNNGLTSLGVASGFSLGCCFSEFKPLLFNCPLVIVLVIYAHVYWEDVSISVYHKQNYHSWPLTPFANWVKQQSQNNKQTFIWLCSSVMTY